MSSNTGPLAFLQVTQVRDVIQDIASPHAHILSEALIFGVVIVDFGGSNAALGKFVDLIQKKEKLQGAGSVVIYVGQEEKVTSNERKPPSEDLQKAFPIVSNIADIRDAVIAKIGRQAYYDDLQANWGEWISDRELTSQI
ncbi:uncharacterized protein ACHE_60547S [Aspergillus chevalieri]|uniref:Uncharacterized protein n=1 Tax=Aspergillus chevalieri TaxID=182096 RepID=A0A7R7VTV4_ASPCH|nr:uncharacterized protein ACHE_60547S [Aspergillus chevalieri]BCR90661.1 hypothetical protein ACHE_60547S [Aspergillus chevalieri]